MKKGRRYISLGVIACRANYITEPTLEVQNWPFLISKNRHAASDFIDQNPAFPRGVCYYKGSFKICKFVIMAKVKKKRASKYDEKLAINGTFDEVIKVSATPYKPVPKKQAKPVKKKS